jgi:PAS domain S-box-containing protein
MSVSTELLDQLLSTIEVNVAILNGDGVIVDVSESWTQFAIANGAPLDAVGVGVNYLDVCRRSAHSADARAALAGIRSVIDGRSPEFRRKYRCDAPGERRLFTMIVRPNGSERPGVIVAHHHNTEIENTEPVYSRLLDSVRAIVWRAELPGFKTTFASKQIGEILGYPADRWTSDPTWWIQQMHPDDRDWVLRFTSEAVEQRRNHSFEYRMIGADGRVVWLRQIVNVIVEGSDPPRELVGVSVDITEQKDAEQFRERFTGRLLTAQEDERRAIARELHDDIGQSVAILHIALANLRTHLGSPKLIAELDDLSSVATRIEKDIQRVSQGLHPSSLTFLGLAGSIRRLCSEFSERTGTALECGIADLPIDLDATLVTTLYRVCQECLRNIGKHSHARNVVVDLSASSREIRLSMTDDGVGFDIASVREVRGLGLVSMSERLKLVGGTLDVSSTPGNGTRVEARVPLRDHRLPVDVSIPSRQAARKDR